MTIDALRKRCSPLFTANITTCAARILPRPTLRRLVGRMAWMSTLALSRSVRRRNRWDGQLHSIFTEVSRGLDAPREDFREAFVRRRKRQGMLKDFAHFGRDQFCWSPIDLNHPRRWRLKLKESLTRASVRPRTARSDRAFRRAAPPLGSVKLTPAASSYVREMLDSIRRQAGNRCMLATIDWLQRMRSKGPNDTEWKVTGPGLGAGYFFMRSSSAGCGADELSKSQMPLCVPGTWPCLRSPAPLSHAAKQTAGDETQCPPTSSSSCPATASAPKSWPRSRSRRLAGRAAASPIRDRERARRRLRL